MNNYLLKCTPIAIGAPQDVFLHGYLFEDHLPFRRAAAEGGYCRIGW